MSIERRTLRGQSDLESLAAAWNALPGSRGVHADLFDSHAWISAWLASEGSAAASFIRVPTVFAGGRPVALLPLVECSPGRFENAGVGIRPRYRPVIASEAPDAETMGLLAEEAASIGVKDLTLLNLPTRDPATRVLIDALKRAGFELSTREGKCESIATVNGNGNSNGGEHGKRFRAYGRSAKESLNRAKRVADVTLDAYGPGDEALFEGLDIYLRLHTKSWKGAVPDDTAHRWRELLRLTEPLGWPCICVLRVGGVPAAATIFFCIGKVFFGYRNVYDQKMAAMGPGTILLWRVHEKVRQRFAPDVFDFMPGRGSQKDRLTTSTPPLLLLEAERKTLVSPLLFPLRRSVRRARRALDERRAHRRKRKQSTPPSPKGSARRVDVEPGPATHHVALLEIDKRIEMYLTVTCGHHSPKSMRSLWEEGDSWWRVGEEPSALVRLGSNDVIPRTVREIVVLGDGLGDGRTHVDISLLTSLATAVDAPLSVNLPSDGADGEGVPIPVHHADLPWPVDAHI